MDIHGRIMRSISLILLCSFFLQGCTHIHTYEMGKSSELVAEINEKAKANMARVESLDGREHYNKDLAFVFKPDSSYWYNADDKLVESLSNSEINEIVFIDRRKGALTGAVATAAGAMLLIIGLTIYVGTSSTQGQQVNEKGIAALAAIVGILVAIPIGAALGHRDEYIFSHQEADDTSLD